MTKDINTTPNVLPQDLERSDRVAYQRRLQDMAQILCWFESNDPNQDIEYAEITAIKETQHEIRSRLHYVFGVMPWESQTEGDCYSFSWHTSLALDELNIKHFIAFTHGHAYCIALDSAGNAHMVNTDQPAMNDFFLTDTQFSGKLITEMTSGAFGDEPRAVVMSTERLKHKAVQDATKRSLAGKPDVQYPWVDEALPATVVMDPAVGRRALYVYHLFCSELDNVANANAATMQAILAAMSAHNPQQETRPKYNEDMRAFKKYVKQLIGKGAAAEEAASLVESYCQCMPEGSKSMQILKGDLFRAIAEGCQQKELALHYAERARNSYIESMPRGTQIDKMRRGKLRACQVIIDRCS